MPKPKLNRASTLGFLLAISCLLPALPALAHEVTGQEGKGGEHVVLLRQQILPDVPGEKAVLLTVDYAPGQASVPHVHSGSVVAYVLEGEVVSQVGGEAPVKYKAGESWYEAPKASHLVSRNASASNPAKLLVWLLVGENEPIKQPLPAR